MDGYPEGKWAAFVLKADSEPAYREAVAKMLSECEHGTTPDRGWPWPWDDSHTTDCAYAFDAGKVWIASWGKCWLDKAVTPADSPCGGPYLLDDRRELQRNDAYWDWYEAVLRPANEPNGRPACVFPNMKNRQKVTMGPRSGLIIIGH
jgi:hypothetical protein